jgi:hypothetical protein
MHVLSPLTSLCMVYRPAHSFSRLYDDRSRLSAVYNRHPTLVSDTPPRDPRRRRISVSARRKTIVQYSSVALDKLLYVDRTNCQKVDPTTVDVCFENTAHQLVPVPSPPLPSLPFPRLLSLVNQCSSTLSLRRPRRMFDRRQNDPASDSQYNSTEARAPPPSRYIETTYVARKTTHVHQPTGGRQTRQLNGNSA